ncbi:MAG: 2-C-methyl-D-erythritol 2,4-cyclodiphosphate synthase [Spirochaetia bacterium]
MLRIGLGSDLHRLTAGKKLIIGGVKIDSPLGCDAHSDGDVLIHALIDAMLGAIAHGDIGDHFPPSDPQYKDIESTILLQKCHKILDLAGFAIVNIDAIISLESPKLFKYKPKISKNIAQLLYLPIEHVSVKAKTNEKVDAIGNSLAIAAQVIVLVETRHLSS